MSSVLRDKQLAVCIVSTLKQPASNPYKIASTMLFFSDGFWYCFGNININIVLSGMCKMHFSHFTVTRSGKDGENN